MAGLNQSCLSVVDVPRKALDQISGNRFFLRGSILVHEVSKLFDDPNDLLVALTGRRILRNTVLVVQWNVWPGAENPLWVVLYLPAFVRHQRE